MDSKPIGARAVVCPHAGWTFSGRLAAMAIASLKAVDTVVVIGGHLAPGSPILCAREKAFGTAAGEIRADAALLKALGDELLEAGIPHPGTRPGGGQ